MPAPPGRTSRDAATPLRANLLGPFSINRGNDSAGPWARPGARRLCQMVLVSPGRRVSRQVARESLFPHLDLPEGKRTLTKTLSMARAGLSAVVGPGPSLLEASRTHIWVNPAVPLEVDYELQADRLRAALQAAAGIDRDNQLALALADDATLLEEEPDAEWALRPREQLEWARQEGRLVLARDRSTGLGRSSPDAVVEAWLDCLDHDPTSEETASALVRVYAGQGRQVLAEAVYTKTRTTLEELGLRLSPAFEEVYVATRPASVPPQTNKQVTTILLAHHRGERRLVSVLFAELSGPLVFGQADPEDLREVVGEALAGLISVVELFGGTVTSVSGAGLTALFGAPQSHEDDPERALRAGYRIATVPESYRALRVRVGVETGQAVVGPIGKHAGADYGAVGEVVTVAAALQSMAKPGSVLVGPTTRAAVELLFEWGPKEEVISSDETKPIVASYVERPRARPAGQAGRRRLAAGAPLVGRQSELEVVRRALRDLTGGKGGVLVLSAEPGLGKTRMVHECRRLFMAWVGASSGRLPLWLEGRAASYASSVPYGLYQQLLAAWVGAAVDEGEDVAKPALGRSMSAVFSGKPDPSLVALLAQVMGLGPSALPPALLSLNPEQLQRATFEAVRAVVSQLTAHGPTVLVLEDLHWSDPTSLRLTREIASLTNGGPLLLVLTRRPEPDPGVSAFEMSLSQDQALVFRTLELLPLLPAAERELAIALLGGAAPDRVIDAVSEGSEGNPLFLEERLSSLLETRALVKEASGWRLDDVVLGQLPEALERLIRSRIDRLPSGPNAVVVAASVLGVEFGWQALDAVSDLDGGLAPAVSELCGAGLLTALATHPEVTYRFRHALIREAIYKGLLRGERLRLHARAAWGLEQAAAGRLDEVAAVLGHHYAMAGDIDRALSYLERAGDHAASAFANDEAVASYQRALSLVRERAQGRAGIAPGGASVAVARLSEKLGQVFLRVGRHGDARAALHEALAVPSSPDRFGQARLQALLGQVEVADHSYDAAMAAFDAVGDLLGERPEEQEQSVVDLWLDVQLDGRAYLYYWRNEPEKGAAVLSAVRPVVEARGTSARRQAFHYKFVLNRMRETRYRIDEEILTNMRAAVAAAHEGGDERDVAFTLFGLGFCLLWRGELRETEECLQASLAGAERVGDAVLRARCLCYLNVCALRRHDSDAVRTLAPLALEAGQATSYPEYVAMAKATQAWLAWQEDQPSRVVDLVTEALGIWGSTPVVYSHCWAGIWPLVAVHIAAGQLEAAVEASRRLLAPPQQRLADDLEGVVGSAIAAWDSGQAQLARDRLAAAVTLADTLGYA